MLLLSEHPKHCPTGVVYTKVPKKTKTKRLQSVDTMTKPYSANHGTVSPEKSTLQKRQQKGSIVVGHIRSTAHYPNGFWPHLSVVRGLSNVVADGELEGLVLVFLPRGNDSGRVQELQVLFRLLVFGGTGRTDTTTAMHIRRK